MEAIARLEQVMVRFGDRRVLDGVDLTIRPGEVTAVLGPSGSGETTLLHTFNRLNELFPRHRQQGRVFLHLDGREREVSGAEVDVTWLRRRVAMVFQSPNLCSLSIERNLALPLELALGIKGAEAEDRIRQALDAAELLGEVADRMHDRATTLSGGQQQRLCLARALVLDPAVLLLDEPTASLDYQASRRVEELIGHLKDRYAIVAVSHSLGQAAPIADRGLVLREGRIVQQVDREILADPVAFRRLVEEVF